MYLFCRTNGCILGSIKLRSLNSQWITYKRNKIPVNIDNDFSLIVHTGQIYKTHRRENLNYTSIANLLKEKFFYTQPLSVISKPSQ